MNRQIRVGDNKFVVYFDPLPLQVQKIELLRDCKRTFFGTYNGKPMANT